MGLVKEIGVAGLCDIAFMSLLIYALLVWFKRTRAVFVLTGILIIGAVYLLATQFGLRVTTLILQGFFAVILVAVIVIFQEELRRFFEQVAVWSLNPNTRRRPVGSFRAEVEILVRTLTDLARERIGALVVIRGKDPIARHLEGGVDLDGELSEPLLKSLFDPHSIGHDGAVVIEQGRVHAFSCHLPLSKDFRQLQHSGTRHAAALGLAERTDALCLVVSEERGELSYARDGELKVLLGAEELNALLEQFYQGAAPRRDARPWRGLVRKNSKEKALAVVLSIILWFVLVHESKSVQRSFSVPVECTSLPQHLMVADIQPPQVEVILSGARRNFYFLDERKIRLVLKLFDARPGLKTITLSESNLAFPRGLSLEYIEPRQVTVHMKSHNQPPSTQ